MKVFAMVLSILTQYRYTMTHANHHQHFADDVAQLQQLVLEQQYILCEKDKVLSDVETALEVSRHILEERDKEIEQLKERLALLLAKRYQHSSEKLDGIQIPLFDKEELEREISALKAALGDKEASQRKARSNAVAGTAAKPKRKPLPDHIARVDIVVDVSEEDLAMMGDEWELVGYEVSEQLAVHEREYFIKRYKRTKYVRKTAHTGDKPALLPAGQYPIKVADPAPVILPKSLADATLLAKILTGKFIDGMSFNRELKVLAREGIEIGYSTICSYPIQLHERLAPIEALLYEEVANASRWHLDETTLQVLQEPGREARQKSYLWAMRAVLDDGELVLFHYHERRNYEALSQWLSPALEAFSGVIVSDEHKPYARLAREHTAIAARGGCWSHCRRKYVDAVKGRRHESDAHLVLQDIAKLYQLNKHSTSLQGDALLEYREALIRPWAEKFKRRVDEMAPNYPDQGLMKAALGYTRNNWQSLTAFLTHSDLVLDNNPVENAIRPFTVGRRNWLYSGSPRGAAASAFIYSLVESAKSNGWEPKQYLTELFERFPYTRRVEQRRLLLPHLLKPT